MNFGEGIQKEQENYKAFVPSSEDQAEFSLEKTGTDTTLQKDLQDLELWRKKLLHKCDALESVGEDCTNLRRIIEDEYIEKKIELHEKVHYVDHSDK